MFVEAQTKFALYFISSSLQGSVGILCYPQDIGSFKVISIFRKDK